MAKNMQESSRAPKSDSQKEAKKASKKAGKARDSDTFFSDAEIEEGAEWEQNLDLDEEEQEGSDDPAWSEAAADPKTVKRGKKPQAPAQQEEADDEDVFDELEFFSAD